MGNNKDSLNFAVTCSDDMSKGFASAMSTARKFSSGLTSVLTAPFKALSSVQTFALIQNVKAIGAAFRSVADTGAEWVRNGFMDAVSMQEFAKRTGTAGQEVYQLGRRLEEAAGGMLNLDNSIKAANELFRKGFSVSSIETFFRFASLRATSTGEDFKSMVDAISTAVLTRRTMTLERLGVVLDANAKKGDILAGVTKALNQQMAMSGVTGNETAFTVNKLAQAWDDATDTLKDLVATSPAVGNLVKWMHELASASREFLNQNFDKMQGLFMTGMGGIGRMAGGAADWAKGLAGSHGEGAVQQLIAGLAKMPVYVAKAVQYIKIGLAEIRASIASLVYDLLEGPLKTLIGGDVASGIQWKMAWAMKGAEDGIRRANKELDLLDTELAQIDQGVKGLKIDEKAAKSARAMADAKVAAKDWWRSLLTIGDAAKRVFDPLKSSAKGVGDAMKESLKSATSEVQRFRDALQAAVTGQRLVNEDIERRDFDVSLARARTPWERNNLRFMFAQSLTKRGEALTRTGDLEGAGRLGTEAMNIWDAMAGEGLVAHGSRGLKQVDFWRKRSQDLMGAIAGEQVGNAQWGLMNAEANKADLLKGSNIFRPLGEVFSRFGNAMDAATQKITEFGDVVNKAKASHGSGTLLDQWFGAVMTSITAGLK